MTPSQWYANKRAEYREATGQDWQHRTDQMPNGWTPAAAEVAETAMRSGVECRALKVNGWDETMMVVNAIMIRDRLSARRNRRHET